eukprot:Gb_05882 [translate_table: standard]
MNQKNKNILFLRPMLQLQCRTTTNAHRKELDEAGANANGNIISREIEISGVVRTLSHQSRQKDTLHILHVMDQCAHDSTYVSLLEGCVKAKNLSEGKLVHTHIIQTGNKSQDIFLGNTLLNLYVKCGSLMDARSVLNQMPKRNVVSWTVMIAAYARHGHDDEALRLFYQMQLAGVQPNQFTFASVLPVCAHLEALEHGKEVHIKIITGGYQSSVFVGSALVDMYVKCGSIENARNVFDKMPERDVVSWNAMIAGYTHNGDIEEALKLFQKMPVRNVVSWNAMIAGYSQNGHVGKALELFQKMPEPNVVSWTSMITAYARHGYCQEALSLFYQMQGIGIQPDQFTFASVLSACANLVALEQGKEIHEEIIRSGFQSDVIVGNALVDLYAKCGSIDNAGFVFNKMPKRDAVSWNTMIAGYALNGLAEEALNLFQKMSDRDVISWNAVISGYAQNGHGEESLKLLQQMQSAGVKSNSETFAIVLPVCANLASLEQGKEIHEAIIRCGLQSDVFVGSALVDMYAKCGSIENAHQVFNKMPRRNVVSWTAMIVGYAMHGQGKEALQLFEQMQHSGTSPNHVTFVGVLSACCHAGLLDAGWQYFHCMCQYYRIIPTTEHYGCMVDLLGRAGHLEEAIDFISKMPVKPEAHVWGSLLSACRFHINIELAEYVAEHLFMLEPTNAAPFVLLSNIYAAAGKWDGIEKVRKMMKDRKVAKEPGCSWIVVNKQVYTFLAGD